MIPDVRIAAEPIANTIKFNFLDNINFPDFASSAVPLYEDWSSYSLHI
jgi:hypothetical protein